MSKISKVKFNCPECGKEVEFDYYESINVTLNPELKEKVINGLIYSVECPSCGHREAFPHPFLYHDMEKKFMIQMGSYGELLDFKEDLQNNPINKDFPGLMEDTNVLGVTSMFDMITAIISFENNLDWRVVQMALLFSEYNFQKYCTDNKKKIKEIVYSRLTNEKNENGDLMIKICVDSENEREEYYCPFSMPMYEHCFKEFKERLDLINPFVFDRYVRDSFCNFYEEDFNLHEEHKNRYTLIETSDGEILVSYDIPDYLIDSVEIGSLILYKANNGKRGIGTIKRILEYNPLAISVPKDQFCSIECGYTEYHFMTTEDSDAKLGQEELIQELLDYKKEKEKRFDESFPIEDLYESKMIVCSKISIAIEGMENGIDDELVEMINKNIETGNSERILSLQKVEKNGKRYLALYTDQCYLPKEKDYLTKAIFDFDTFARIIKVDPRYDGIIINQFDDAIILNQRTIELYIQCRTLANEERMKKLLDDLTPNEIKFMSERSYQCIRSIYFDGLKPKELESKYNISEEEVDRALDRGYNTLEKIVYSRF